MKRIYKLILKIVFLSLPLLSFTQEISVQSFKHLAGDMDARANHPMEDQNGEKCAIIKVVTSEQGYTWEGDMNGIVDTKHNTAEYWLYVPHGSKQLSILHPQLGVLRNYRYPQAIEEAHVYELVLKKSKLSGLNEEKKVFMQWMIVKSTPDGADVYIDDQYVGVTPYQKKMQVGVYDCRVQKTTYHSFSNRFNIEKDKRASLDIVLDPAFGFLNINCKPEEGASIEIDERLVLDVSPLEGYKILSGKHQVVVKKVMFDPKTIEIEITDGNTENLVIDLVPNFGSLKVETSFGANVFVDGEDLGKGNVNTRLMPGVHDVEVRLENHQKVEKQILITKGENEYLRLDPVPIMGAVDVNVEPMDSEIFIDGKKYGLTPTTIYDLLIGKHELLIKKEGYHNLEQTIIVDKDNVVEVNKKLVKSIIAGKGFYKDPRDGKEYKTIEVGNNIWFAENLNFDSKTGSWNYNNDLKNGNKYGRLYTWEVAEEVCPCGWHLATKENWISLENTLEKSSRSINKGAVASQMKSSNVKGKSGFNALMAGSKAEGVGYKGLHSYAKWWSKNELGSENAWFFEVGDGESLKQGLCNKSFGLSVRCVKD